MTAGVERIKGSRGIFRKAFGLSLSRPTTPALAPMSNTSKTKARRRRKKAAQGQDRKKKLEKDGTTPKFPIRPDKAPTPAKA